MRVGVIMVLLCVDKILHRIVMMKANEMHYSDNSANE